MEYMTVTHTDGKTQVKAKVIKRTALEIEVEYKHEGIIWGQHLPVEPPKVHEIMVQSWTVAHKYPCPGCAKKVGYPDYTCLKCNIKVQPKIKMQF